MDGPPDKDALREAVRARLRVRARADGATNLLPEELLVDIGEAIEDGEPMIVLSSGGTSLTVVVADAEDAAADLADIVWDDLYDFSEVWARPWMQEPRRLDR